MLFLFFLLRGGGKARRLRAAMAQRLLQAAVRGALLHLYVSFENDRPKLINSIN
jgi:hypothetical protein